MNANEWYTEIPAKTVEGYEVEAAPGTDKIALNMEYPSGVGQILVELPREEAGKLAMNILLTVFGTRFDDTEIKELLFGLFYKTEEGKLEASLNAISTKHLGRPYSDLPPALRSIVSELRMTRVQLAEATSLLATQENPNPQVS